MSAELHWYHMLERPGGELTPGWFDTRAAVVRILWPRPSLDGLRRLDVGTWDGVPGLRDGAPRRRGGRRDRCSRPAAGTGRRGRPRSGWRCSASSRRRPPPSAAREHLRDALTPGGRERLVAR